MKATFRRGSRQNASTCTGTAGPNLPDFGPKLADIGRSAPNIGRHRAKFGPMSVKLEAESANATRPKSFELGPALARDFRKQIGPTSAKPGAKSTNLSRGRAKFE